MGLSGGRYHATVYHLGILKKLKETSVLDDIDVISSISASIISSIYGLYGSDFKSFEDRLIIIN